MFTTTNIEGRDNREILVNTMPSTLSLSIVRKKFTRRKRVYKKVVSADGCLLDCSAV